MNKSVYRYVLQFSVCLSILAFILVGIVVFSAEEPLTSTDVWARVAGVCGIVIITDRIVSRPK